MSWKSQMTGDMAIKGHHARLWRNEAVGLTNGTIALRRLDASRPHRWTCRGTGQKWFWFSVLVIP